MNKIPRQQRGLYNVSPKFGLNQMTDEVSEHFIDVPKGSTWEESKEKIKKKCIKSIRQAVENSKKH